MNQRVLTTVFFSPTCIAGLSLLTILFSIVNMDNYWKSDSTVRIVLPAEGKGDGDYFGENMLREFKRKRIIAFVLKGDESDKGRLDMIRSVAAEIKHTCNTNTIIKIHFTNNAYYGEFIRLLNFMIIDMHRRYTFYKDDFYIVPPKKHECEGQNNNLLRH